MFKLTKYTILSYFFFFEKIRRKSREKEFRGASMKKSEKFHYWIIWGRCIFGTAQFKVWTKPVSPWKPTTSKFKK